MFIQRHLLRTLGQRKYLVSVIAFTGALLTCMHLTPAVFLNQTDGPCEIPKLDPWDKTVDRYMHKEPPIECSRKQSLLYVDANGYLKLNASAVSQYNIQSLKCIYRIVQRNGDFKVYEEPAVPFTPPVFIQGRTFRVTCNDASSRVVYDFIHVNIAWNDSRTEQKHIGLETDEQLSIIYIGLDSVSRSHAIRNLPLTLQYLKKTLGAYDLEGFMKVGTNTFPNVAPLLTGKSHFALEAELANSLNDQGFIWEEKHMPRYVTHFSEDRPEIGIFTFQHNGFVHPPVDYFYRPYSLAMAQTEPIISDILGTSTRVCYGNQKHLHLQIDFFKRFMNKYKGRLKFAFLWNNQMSHEEFTALQRYDESVLELMKWLHKENHLERAVLIVGSDHGFRLGGYSTTHVGRLENNMPLLTLRVPDILKSKYNYMHNTLEQNTQRLVVAYDLHETMLNVISSKFVQSEPPIVSHSQVARSLFSKIPESRTCSDAGIPVHYCSCNYMPGVDTSSELVQYFARYIVTVINRALEKHEHNCSKLLLHNVTEAKVAYSATGDVDKIQHKHSLSYFEYYLTNANFDHSGRYVLLFYTLPGDALFQASVEYTEQIENDNAKQVTMLSEPARLDKYAQQSYCIKGTKEEQYCYCKHALGSS